MPRVIHSFDMNQGKVITPIDQGIGCHCCLAGKVAVIAARGPGSIQAGNVK